MFEAAGAFIATILKDGVRIYVAALFASGMSLFMPEAIAQNLGIAGLRQTYRLYLGGVFIVSISLLVAYGLSALSDWGKGHLMERRSRRRILNALEDLTAEEKKFLSMFVVEGRNTVHVPISDGIAGGLVAKCIVYRSSRVFHAFSAPYNLQPIARKLLTESPTLLD